jgi:hypothetical protein
MGGECSTHEREENKILVKNPKGINDLGDLRVDGGAGIIQSA